MEVGRVVRRAGVDHVPARLQERRRQLVLGLGLALRDVDEAPQRRLFAEPALARAVEAALGEARRRTGRAARARARAGCAPSGSARRAGRTRAPSPPRTTARQIGRMRPLARARAQLGQAELVELARGGPAALPSTRAPSRRASPPSARGCRRCAGRSRRTRTRCSWSRGRRRRRAGRPRGCRAARARWPGGSGWRRASWITAKPIRIREVRAATTLANGMGSQ